MISRVTLLLLTILILPAAASAAPTWLPPAPAFTSGSLEAATAMAPDGTALLLRVANVPTEDPDNPLQVLEEIVRTPDGKLSDPVELTRTDAGRRIAQPVAWAAPDGSFVVGYGAASKQSNPGGSDWRLIYLSPAGKVIRTQQEATVQGIPFIPVPHFDAKGNTYLVAPVGARRGDGFMIFRFGDDPNAADVPLPTLPAEATDDRYGASSLAVAPDGKLLVAYFTTYTLGDTCNRVFELNVVEGTADSLGAPQKLFSSMTTGAKDPLGNCVPAAGVLLSPGFATGFDAQGVPAVAYQTYVPDAQAVTVHATRELTAATWSAAQTIGDLAGGTESFEMVNAGSALHLVMPNGLSDPVGSVLRPDGTWTPAQVLGSQAAGPNSAQSPLGDGSVLYTWITLTLGPNEMLARRLLSDGTLSETTKLVSPITLPEPAGYNVVSTGAGSDAAGNAIVAYAANDGQLRFLGFDNAGPVLSGPSFPAGGGAFSAGPVRDLWSPVSALAWDFGDGATGAGASVAHTYAPGAYTAKLTATDAVGNAATVSGAVSIAAPAPPAAPQRGPSPDTAAPSFTRQPSIKRGTITFGLSEDANVVAKLTHEVKGVKKGKKCVARPKKKSTKRLKACKREVTDATLRGAFKAGLGTFKAKLLKHRRTYKLTITATDAAGNTSTAKLTYRAP